MANTKRRCTFCRQYRPAGDGIKLPAGFFCNMSHAIEYANAKQLKSRQKNERKETRKAKDRIKTAGELTKEAQVSVNKYIRLRDAGRPCISCGSLPAQKIGGTMDAGHYRSRGSAGHLRFNTFNISSQCVKCNRFNSGNAVDYRINLIIKIGRHRVERLEQDNKPRKFTKDYLRRLKKVFGRRYRHLLKLRRL